MPKLSDNLEHFWKLNETGVLAARVDAVAGAELDPNGTGVSARAGMIGNAANFDQTTYLVGDDATEADFHAESFSLVVWVLFDVTDQASSGQHDIVARWGASGVQYLLDFLDTTDRVRWTVRNIGNTANQTVSADNLGLPTPGVWYMFGCVVDIPNLVSKISVNGGAFEEVAIDGVNHDADTPLTLGKRQGAVTTLEANKFNGAIDELGFWRRDLSQQELQQLYNNGDGMTLEQIIAASADEDGARAPIGLFGQVT